MNCVRLMNGDELCEFMEVFKLNTKTSHILNPSIITYDNGDIYKGEVNVLKGNLKHGYGELLYNNGDLFATKWKNDLAQGAGIYISNDETYIQGNWKNGLLNYNTNTTIIYPNGDYYNGHLFNNCINGSNYINLNFDTQNFNNLTFYEQIYNWLEQHSQKKIIILDKTGLANGMSLCIYLIMKSSNTPFEIIYDNLSKITKLNNKLFYKFLQDSEKNIIKNDLNSMDISD